VLYFLIILPNSSPPDASLRATIQADLRAFGDKLRKLIAVPIGDGMWLALVRTIIRRTLLLSGQSKQQIVESSLERGLDRVLEFASPETPARTALQADIDEMFRALGVANQPR
jgi:hypothetical protein